MLDIDPADLAGIDEVERDSHGNVRIAEVNIGEILKAQVVKRLKDFDLKTTIVAKNIGYELRCADPVPFDLEYTRDLGYCAAKYLLSGGNAVMIWMRRQLRTHPVRPAHRSGNRPHPAPPGRHPLDAVRDRQAVHDPPAPRRLRGPPRARQVRRHRRRHAPALPRRVPAT